MNSRQLEIVREDCSKIANSTNISELSKLKNKHLFISGGSGYVATWIAELVNFLNSDHAFNTQITLCARNTNLVKQRSPHLLNNSLITLQNANVCDLDELPSDTSYIVHAAGNPDNRMHSSDPLRVFNTIVNGTENVLSNSLRLSYLEKIANLSSGLVYGPQPQSMEQIPESYSNGGPNTLEAGTSIYAEAKRMAESICSIYRTQSRLPIVNIRPFAFIGPYQLIDRPWAINNFIHDALKGNPIKILGDPMTLRSYMYPSDMAFWILKMLVKGETGSNYNLGSPTAHSLDDVATTVAEAFNHRFGISKTGTGINRKRSVFIPSIEKAKDELNLTITVDFKTAIKRTVEWIKID